MYKRMYKYSVHGFLIEYTLDDVMRPVCFLKPMAVAVPECIDIYTPAFPDFKHPWLHPHIATVKTGKSHAQPQSQ
jgi:hypothetical protein